MAAPSNMPRVLDVRDFAAAREAEILALYQTLKAQPEACASKQKFPRHLRRRATSHRRSAP